MTSNKISRVLLCRPTYFTVDYIINPHMRPYSVNQPRAMRQWEKLVNTLKALSIKVDFIEQKEGVPDMVFAADQGIVRNGEVLLANFRYSQRKSERIYYRDWFRKNGFRLRALSNAFPFEGGDTLFFGPMLFIGTAFRASVATCEELAQKLDVDAIPLRLVDPYYYHLDMCFLPIDTETAFYYPPAFSVNSQKLLKRLIPNLLPLTSGAAKAYAANSFVSGKDIVISTNLPISFRQQLNELSFRIHELEMDEFKKAGGGIHCLINVLA